VANTRLLSFPCLEDHL